MPRKPWEHPPPWFEGQKAYNISISLFNFDIFDLPVVSLLIVDDFYDGESVQKGLNNVENPGGEWSTNFLGTPLGF